MTDIYNVKIEQKEKSQIEIVASIPWDQVQKEREGAIKALSENVSIDGFRKGSIPENILVQHVGEMRILTEMAERTLRKVYPKIIEEHKIHPIGQPRIDVTKLAPENDLEFKVGTAILPEIAIPDYKKIARDINAKKEDTEVTEKEILDGITHLQQEWARHEKFEKAQQEAEDPKSVDPTKITVTPEELPELNDEFVQKIGNFKTVEEFKTRFRDNLLSQKKLQAEERKRGELINALIEKTKVDLPEIIIESEIDTMMRQFEIDVKNAGFNLDDYLKQTGKTKDDLRAEWRADAEKRAKTQLALSKIAEEEELAPTSEEVEEQVNAILKEYPKADKRSAEIYVRSTMQNQKVIGFLESQK